MAMNRTLESSGLQSSVMCAPGLSWIIIIASLVFQVPWHSPRLHACRSRLPLTHKHRCAVNCHPHLA
eukprot:37504-Chlamydomonas_euryale.AAC.12